MDYFSKSMANCLKLLLCCSLLLISESSLAEEKIAPEQIKGVTKVSAVGVIKLIERINDLIIVDSRIKGDRNKGFIESSISLPDTKTNCKSLSNIIPSYHNPVMFYCNGIKCGRSVVAIQIAKKCGFKQLYWFRGGFEAWMENGLPYINQ